jgi:hypothetical protein
MNFLAHNKLTKAVVYYRDKTRLDRIVEEQVRLLLLLLLVV